MVAWVVLAVPAGAEEIFSWTDAAGHLHFTNSPSFMPTDTGTERAVTAPLEPGADAEAEPGARSAPAEQDVGAGAGEASPEFSTQASLRRTALERDLRATEKQIQGIDDRAAALARARQRNVRGSAATGGVGANPDMKSEEEKELAKEREALADHAAQVRSEGAQLRGEVTTRLGSTPAWWTDVR